MHTYIHTYIQKKLKIPNRRGTLCRVSREENGGFNEEKAKRKEL